MVIYPIFVFLISLSVTSALKQCNDSQKLRVTRDGVEICCSTVKCGQSKTFAYCTYEDGSDRCIDCPPGTYTGDTFDTKQFPAHHPEKWHEVPTICASIPSCELKETIKVGTKCRCNLDKGYFGEDSNNCILDRQKCTNRGVQLTIKGQCDPCPADTFKPEDGHYRQCRNRTRCKAYEEETHPGSSTTDRRCKKKEITQTTTVGPPNITSAPGESSDEKSTPVEACWINYENFKNVLQEAFLKTMILFTEFCRNYSKEPDEPVMHELEPLNQDGNYVALCTNSKVDSNDNPNGPHDHPYENGGGITRPREQTDLKVVDESPNNQDRKKDKSNGVPTTVKDATSIISPGQDGYVSLGDSLYNNDPTSSVYSENQTDTSESIKSQETCLLSNNSTEEFMPPRNIPTPSLLGSLETTHDSTNSKESYSTGGGVAPKSDTGEDHIGNNKRGPVLNLTEKKNEACTERPVGTVSPIIRPDPQNQQSQNDGQIQDFQPSNTTTGGIDIGAATNNDNYKFVPSHANHMEYYSGHGGNLAAVDTQNSNEPMNGETQESSSQYSNPSVSQPLSSNGVRPTEPEGNGTNSSESGTPRPFRTNSGREVCTPESANNSEESSIEHSSREEVSFQS
ncbi:unnamed protein product [Mytilus edulis]|uniref:Uncharacterized protein n=1 Tax=Mytilus edulis TaxID=6550 RepID=A0A8S3R6Z1_MYTED|nr:unnamed protein product [Mytilus edulis]